MSGPARMEIASAMMARTKDPLMMARIALLLPTVLALLLAGCPEGGAELTVTPASIDFGEVVVGRTIAQQFEVTNTGSLACAETSSNTTMRRLPR